MPSRQYTSTDQSGNTTKTKIYSCSSYSTAARIVRENGMKIVKKGERENANPVGNAIRVLRASNYKIHKKDTSASKDAAENNPWIEFKRNVKKKLKNGSLKCGEIVDYTSTTGENTEYIVGVGGFLVKTGKQGQKPKSGQQTQQTQQTKTGQQQKQQKQQKTTNKKNQPVATRRSSRIRKN